MILDLLDRYLLGRWLRIVAVATIGFPVVVVIMEIVDGLNRLLDAGLTTREIVLAGIYGLPANAVLVMPAAVLCGTVFTVAGLGRFSELTAAKAGGRSFRRMTVPFFGAAALVALLAFAVGELAPRATQRELELKKQALPGTVGQRYNFVFRAERGWVYVVTALDRPTSTMRGLLLERQGVGAEYPTIVVTADSATWDSTAGAWTLHAGATRLLAAGVERASFTFASLRLAALAETPAELLAQPKSPEEMTYAELGAYIDALRRSGNDTAKLETERALKVAVPFTCLVVVLFGAPLAITGPRAGAAWGVAVSLGTTITFLLLAQIARAIGAGGVVDPALAAWLPNLVFLGAGTVLFARVRS